MRSGLYLPSPVVLERDQIQRQSATQLSRVRAKFEPHAAAEHSDVKALASNAGAVQRGVFDSLYGSSSPRIILRIAMSLERQIEEQLIDKLQSLKYEYRQDIRDRDGLVKNFRRNSGERQLQ